MKTILSVLILSLISTNVLCSQKVRGVVPERASLYDEFKQFTCLDGSSVIPFNQVNDDYCDCRDGSDEPGTSACMNSSFACENLGYIVQLVPSSRVNDGICDCCDGSDEYNSNVVCENKCIALAAKMREEEEKLKILTDQGKAKRKELADQGVEIRKALEDKLKELETSKTNAEVEKTRLEALKNEAEAKSNEAKEKQDKILEEKAKQLEKLETLRLTKVMFAELDTNKDNYCSPDELLKHPELDILFDNDGQFTLEESTRLLDQNDKVDLELFSTVYYEKLVPHLNNKTVESVELPPVPTAASETNTEEPIETTEESNIDHNDSEDNQDNNEYQDEQSATDDHSDKESDTSKYNEETQNLIEEANKAKSAYQVTVDAFNSIESELKETKEKLDLDTGVNAEFATMLNTCFEYEDREYIYKLCPFDKTVQKSKSNNAETTIGQWSAWGTGSNKYSQMVFNNGLACWNGPQRSTLVRLTCGIESKVFAVSEPNRCEYEMKFETPAVCEDMKTNQTVDNHEEL